MKPILIAPVFLASLIALPTWAGTLDDVKFLPRIETYETIGNTTLITQEGKKIPLDNGTIVNVAGFTETEAFVISRTDRPNGFIRKTDLAPVKRSNTMETPRIKEQTIP